MEDIIIAKRDKKALSKEDIHFFIKGYIEGKIPDYQVSALLMAIVLNGMNEEEISNLTEEMRTSGDTWDLSEIPGLKVDKHSTGGVGDKVTLILGPMIASCGAKLAKMSGRGLGHTGGTIDKMEAIPGMKTFLTKEDFIKQINKIGLAVISQDDKLVPADKKIYALRDVTGTVESIPLIASSIMSKKLAIGTDCILLDVKWGEGAFMKTVERANELANCMVKIGKSFNKDVRAEITDMNQPLGMAIGNILEIKECIETLQGRGPPDLNEICLSSGAILLEQSKIFKNRDEARKVLEENLKNGKAYNKFREFVIAQGGDVEYCDHPEKFAVAKNLIQIKSKSSGYIKSIKALEIGTASMKLGGGREKLDDIIDMTAGIMLNKKVGDKIEKDELLCTLHTNKENVDNIIKMVENAFIIVNEKVDISHTLTHNYVE
jgi:pyrimidine-nucleoside phosphorylase